jgi:hypothetical protein
MSMSLFIGIMHGTLCTHYALTMHSLCTHYALTMHSLFTHCTGVFTWGGHIYVANREAHEVLVFDKEGSLVRVLPGVPDGSRCGVCPSELIVCAHKYAHKTGLQTAE